MKRMLSFIEIENVENIVDISGVRGNPHWLLELFLKHEWDVLYIIEGEK